MKIIIFNTNTSQSEICFFDVLNELPNIHTKSIEDLPRVLGSNEYFQRMEESEAKHLIEKYVREKGFYQSSGYTVRFYNPKYYSEIN